MPLLFSMSLSYRLCSSLPKNRNPDWWGGNTSKPLWIQSGRPVNGRSPFIQQTLSQYLGIGAEGGQKSQCFTTLGRLKGRPVSVETVCRCQMSYRWVMVTSRRGMRNFHWLEGRQREDCLLIKKTNEGGSLCMCVFVCLSSLRILMLCYLSRHLWHIADPWYLFSASCCVFVQLCTHIVVRVCTVCEHGCY